MKYLYSEIMVPTSRFKFSINEIQNLVENYVENKDGWSFSRNLYYKLFANRNIPSCENMENVTWHVMESLLTQLKEVYGITLDYK